MYLTMEVKLKDGVNRMDFCKKVNKVVFGGDDNVSIHNERLVTQYNTDFYNEVTMTWYTDDITLKGLCSVWTDEHLEQLNQMEEVISFEGEWEDGEEEFIVVVGDKDGIRFPCKHMTRWEWWIGYRGNDIDDYYEWFYNDGKLEDEEKEGGDYYMNQWLEEKVQIEEWLKTNKEGSLRTINQKEVQ